MKSFTVAIASVHICALILLAALLAPWPARAADAMQLPTLGDGSEMSSSVERRLGDRIAREIYRDPDYIDDPVLADYVQGIWQPLLAAARGRGDLSSELSERFAWELMLGRDRTVNAFALPGGYFGVHLGLLAVVSSRDELASVLGHELSHVTQRHISRVMAKQAQQTPWMIGAMILGALAASKSADAGSALIVGGQAVAAQNQHNFSRDMEREADRIGFGVMTQAGFEAQGFVSMFEKLQQASRLNDSGAYPYLRSHPLTTERIADMQGRQPLGAGNAPSAPPSIEHAIMTARARVLSNPGVDALRAIASVAPATSPTTAPLARRLRHCTALLWRVAGCATSAVLASISNVCQRWCRQTRPPRGCRTGLKWRWHSRQASSSARQRCLTVLQLRRGRCDSDRRCFCVRRWRCKRGIRLPPMTLRKPCRCGSWHGRTMHRPGNCCQASMRYRASCCAPFGPRQKPR